MHESNPPNWRLQTIEQHTPRILEVHVASACVEWLPQQVLDEVMPLTEVFLGAGHTLYLVGGIVRDLQLGVPIEALDFDLTTDARPDRVKELVGPLASAVWAQGERFGTIGCRIGDRPMEITTHRAETYTDSSRKPEVQFGDDIELDLSRRDFTLNAMAVRLATERSNVELIDPFDGVAALEARILRTPIKPEVSFNDDPLRILRAARFITRYSLSVEDEVFEAAKSLSERMSIVSVERIRDELDKLLDAAEPSSGLAFLGEVGAWPFVAEFIPVSALEQIGIELDRSRVSNDLRRAILFSHCSPEDRRSQLSALRYSNSETRELRLLLGGFDVIGADGQAVEPTTVRRLVDRVGYESIPLLLELVDVRAVKDRGVPELFTVMDAEEDLSNLTPHLDGEAIMDLLGIESGPEIGAALGVLQERRLEEGPIDRAGEVEYLLEKYRRRLG